MKTIPAAPERRNQTILVGDGERHIALLFQLTLGPIGHKVISVYDAVEAVNLLASYSTPPPNRVVLDQRMPKMTGYEVLTWIRTHEKLHSLWVALHFSSELERDAVLGLPYRADAYLLKPFDPRKLLD